MSLNWYLKVSIILIYKKIKITAVCKVHEFHKELNNFETPWNLELG